MFYNIVYTRNSIKSNEELIKDKDYVILAETFDSISCSTMSFYDELRRYDREISIPIIAYTLVGILRDINNNVDIENYKKIFVNNIRILEA